MFANQIFLICMLVIRITAVDSCRALLDISMEYMLNKSDDNTHPCRSLFWIFITSVISPLCLISVWFQWIFLINWRSCQCVFSSILLSDCYVSLHRKRSDSLRSTHPHNNTTIHISTQSQNDVSFVTIAVRNPNWNISHVFFASWLMRLIV